MSVYDITSAKLTKDWGIDVPEVYVIVAKQEVMGLDASQIAETLSCQVADIVAVTEVPLYQRVKGEVAGARAEETLQTSQGWDAIEGLAVEKLFKRLQFTNDAEFLLKTAAIANRMTRRTPVDSKVLDPGLRAGRTTITLTRRLVSKINGREEIAEEKRELSIHDGSMANPSFQEVDELLRVQTSPVLPKVKEITTRGVDVTHQDLMEAMAQTKR